MKAIKGSTNRFVFLFLATVATSIVAYRIGFAQTTTSYSSHKSWLESRASQLVFFAVLEGLYRDGVANSDVDQITPPGKNGIPTFDLQNFVYACPLCHPAFEAFREYRRREPFFGLKARIDKFGSGLDPVIGAQLHSPDAAKRRQAIQGLINRWVSQRLEMMRLTAAEREEITREMEEGRKQGMGGLKNSPQASASRTNCPICDGSFGACKLQTQYKLPTGASH